MNEQASESDTCEPGFKEPHSRKAGPRESGSRADDPKEFDQTGDLPPAARRALAEADKRRRASPTPASPPEVGGRQGLDPVRYGDWEKGGIVSDF